MGSAFDPNNGVCNYTERALQPNVVEFRLIDRIDEEPTRLICSSPGLQADSISGPNCSN